MIELNGHDLTCEDLHRVAHGAPVRLSPAAAAAMATNAASIPPGPSVLQRKRQWLVGEIAEGMGDDELCRAFILGHCAGVGDPFPETVVRAAIAARANVLATGLCGCRPAAAEALVRLLDSTTLPVVPSQGSVGAAGDLAPLAHIAAVACGYVGAPADLPPLKPTPEEALALINGATVTTALAALVVVRAERVLRSAVAATAMTMEATRADTGCIDARPLIARGHPGAVAVAADLRGWLDGSALTRRGEHADAFSIRCAPAVLGAAQEALVHTRAVVERELNGAADNPLLFDDGWIEAGNFHGAPIALAMDHLKVALTQVATQSERRTFRLSYGHLSSGLPSFLVEGTGLNSGFMLAQYTAASLASECKGLAFPASVDSIPTVQHHEDHVSMGPISARMALQLVECVADIVAIEALLAAQALDLRRLGRAGHPPTPPAPRIEAARATLRAEIPYWEDDGLLHPALVAAGRLVRDGALCGDVSPW